MEGVKELLSSKYFSSFGYIVALFHLPPLAILSGYTGSLRTSERRTFSCASSPDSRDECLVKYDEHYNSPFPLYGFVLLCFLSPLAVCIAYSWCFVKSRVDEIEIALKPDTENPRRRPRLRTRRVFYSYFLHLLVRLVLGILFVVLQNFVFYLDGFPTEFACVSAAVKPTVILNSTDFNVTKDDGLATDCVNSVGSENATCAMGIWVVNILFATLVLVELCYLSVRALQSEEFTFDSKFCQRHLFNQSGTTVTEARLRMQRQVCEETEFLEPLIAQPEIKTKNLLDDIFVDLVIYTGRAIHQFTDLTKRHEIFEIYLKPQHGSIPIEKLDELFHPNEDTQCQDPRKILIIGRPGIGKSLLCQKLSRDWSKGNLLRDGNKIFEHLFMCQFRWFNSETSTNISLKHLLSRLVSEGSINNDVLQDMLDNPEKVLLIFDGLDEFKHHDSCLEDERAQSGNSPTEEMPFSALYLKLMKGKQLPGATVVTTCRPNVLQSLAGLQFDRRVEIMGFTPEKVQEYVYNFFACDIKTRNRVWGHISSNTELLSLCYIPMNSRIVCSILKELIKLQDQDSGSALPTTSTEIYNGALRLFIFKCHPEFKGKQLTEDYLVGNVGFSDSVEKTLSQVESLAKTGIEERRLVFDSAEVKGIEDCGLFNRLPNRQIAPFKLEPQFCFIHLTLQELLAARKVAKMKPSDVSDFITSNVPDPKWHLVIQFVAGLLGGQGHESINCYISLLCDILTEELPMKTNETKQKSLLLIKCLHECNNETILEKVASKLQENSKFGNRLDLSGTQVTPADCTSIAHFLTHLQEPSVLDLSDNNVADEGVAHLCGALKDGNCKLTGLDLSLTNITDQGVVHLCGALKDGNCNLTELDLRSTNITDQGVAHLCGALKDVNCKLTKLDLRMTKITNQAVVHLCGALKDGNCKLTGLELSWTKITDQGVVHLCGALKDGNCKLTGLDLSWTKITDQGVVHLCGALKDGNCNLTELDLRMTSITDQGVVHLCGALKDGNCKLTELDLSETNITDQGVVHLCSALKDGNCNLFELDLRMTSITDQGVVHLCNALKDGNCKLTELDLSKTNITDQGAAHLCDALKDGNCKLTELDLSETNITDQGVVHLCSALKDGNCNLFELDLRMTSITDQGVVHLCNALKDGNCKLTELDLRMTNITDQEALFE